jgi:hypothetical protein
MTPGIYDLTVYRGDTYRYRFTLWLDAGRTQPADLTNAVAKAEIRTKAGGELLGVMECTITLPNIVDGLLDAETTQLLSPKGAVWDLQLAFGDPPTDVKTALAGTVVVTADVTDSGGVLYG